MKSSPYLSIVMPAYNEVPNFKNGVLKPTFDYLSKQKYSWEAIFVNDGSSDDTVGILSKFCKENPACRLITIEHGGRGAAYSTGMLAAQGQYILYTDFDQSTPIVELDHFWPLIKSGNDIVIGIRGQGENKERVDSAFNKFRANVYIVLGQVLFGFTFKDFNCGFKLYTNSSAKKIFSSWIVNRPKKIKGGFMGAVDVEILHLATKFGYKVAEVPVAWFHRPTHGTWKEPILVLIDFLKIKFYDLLGRYDK